jgi:transcriptional regulator with XRE-family HTH domain
VVTEPSDRLPDPPAEAALLRLVRKARDITVADAAKAVGISKAWLSSIENGHDTRGPEGVRPVRASDTIVAHLAAYLRISPERLETEGDRPDAALVLREILAIRRREAAPPRPDFLRFKDDPVRDALGAEVWEQNLDDYGKPVYDDPVMLRGVVEYKLQNRMGGTGAAGEDRRRAAG